MPRFYHPTVLNDRVLQTFLNESTFFGSRVINDMRQFKHEADVIVANRLTDDLNDVADKIYSRDLFGND
jgi:UDPglucose 6-dehydrogenase